MIKHIVCFKIKEKFKDQIPLAKKTLESMKGNVPTVIDLKVGIDFLHSERSYDIILEVILNSKEDLLLYQKDEYHTSVVKTLMHEIRSASVSVDYEFE
jgi:hypothetical protein